MDERVRQLRATVEELRQGSAPRATRFSAAFREQVIALAKGRRAAGAPLVRTASELGLHGRTIGRWLRGAPNEAGGTAPKRHFRRVTVAPTSGETSAARASSPAGGLVVLVGSLRIEGLDLDGLVRLVRALGA
jgi:transposase-like protein